MRNLIKGCDRKEVVHGIAPRELPFGARQSCPPMKYIPRAAHSKEVHVNRRVGCDGCARNRAGVFYVPDKAVCREASVN